jgi:hypothetical protein
VIVVSLLLFLAGVALLAAGLVSESILLEAGSIGAALLAAMVLYFGVRQREVAPTEEPDVPPLTQNFPPVQSTWSRPAGDDVPPASAPEADRWPRDPDQDVTRIQQNVSSAEPPPPADEPDEEIVSDAEAMRVAGRSDDVLVVDGRPRYHLQLCSSLDGDETVPLPVSEAREAGFTPCARCRPDAHILGDAWRSGS